MNNLQDYITQSFEVNENNIAIVDSNGEQITYKQLQKDVISYYLYIVRHYGENQRMILDFKDMKKMITLMIAGIYSNNTFITMSEDCSEERKLQIRDLISDAIELNDLCNLDEFQGQDSEIVLKQIIANERVPTYIYFTSGTTGVPKAVLGKNESLLHYILWEIDEFNINSNHCFAQITDAMFDPFLRDIFVPLLSGGRIALRPNPHIMFLPRLFIKWLKDNKVTCMHCTPSLLNMVVVGLQEGVLIDMDYIFIAGEKILSAYIDKWTKIFVEKTTFVNLYGPTETTLAKCFYVIDRRKDVNEQDIPVGRPIRDEQVLILNAQNRICDENVLGEIYIGMKYGSWGYLNGVEKERYVIINEYSDIPFYKTGDVGYSKNGMIYVAGRNDRQVKISGIRIELDAIENIVMEHFDVQSIAAFADDGAINICVVAGKNSAGADTIKRYIRNHFMLKNIAIAVYFTNRISITVNGKKDYKEVKKRIKVANIDEDMSS